MFDNPFAPPQTRAAEQADLIPGDPRLSRIAILQHWAPYCLPAYLLTFPASYYFSTLGVRGLPFLTPLSYVILAYVALYLVTLAATIFYVVGLGAAIYRPLTGVLAGVLSLAPLVGALVLLLLIVRATELLRSRGHRVGMFGNPSLKSSEPADDGPGEATGPFSVA